MLVLELVQEMVLIKTFESGYVVSEILDAGAAGGEVGALAGEGRNIGTG